MKEVLSQEEVDELLKAIRGGQIPVEEDKKKEEKEQKYQKYDFKKLERYASKIQLPALNVIHGRFAAILMTNLGALLRKKLTQIKPHTASIRTYEVFQQNLPVPSYFFIFSIKPLRGMALLSLTQDIGYTIIDILLGGDGSGISTKPEGREFTKIEQRILTRVVNSMLRAYAEAWAPVVKLEPEVIRIESEPQFVQLTDPKDLIAEIRFDVILAERRGEMYIGIPFSALETIRDKLQMIYSASVEIDRNWIRKLVERLVECPVELKAVLGHTHITLGDLLSLSKGKTLVLNSKADSDDVIVFVQGVPKYLGIPGKIVNYKAVKITRVVITEEDRLDVESKII